MTKKGVLSQIYATNDKTPKYIFAGKARLSKNWNNWENKKQGNYVINPWSHLCVMIRVVSNALALYQGIVFADFVHIEFSTGQKFRNVYGCFGM